MTTDNNKRLCLSFDERTEETARIEAALATVPEHILTHVREHGVLPFSSLVEIDEGAVEELDCPTAFILQAGGLVKLYKKDREHQSKYAVKLYDNFGPSAFEVEGNILVIPDAFKILFKMQGIWWTIELHVEYGVEDLEITYAVDKCPEYGAAEEDDDEDDDGYCASLEKAFAKADPSFDLNHVQEDLVLRMFTAWGVRDHLAKALKITYKREILPGTHWKNLFLEVSKKSEEMRTKLIAAQDTLKAFKKEEEGEEAGAA